MRKTKGRGALVTFLSKSFINKLIAVIGSFGQSLILNDLKRCKTYSIMVDSTQDVAVMDQFAICVRYVIDDQVYERLLDLVVVEDSSGQGLFNLIKTRFESLNIPLSNIIACSFDGASNMSGTYHGLQAYLKQETPSLIYTHCMAHTLNLVISDSTANCILAENFFGLVQESAVFISNSHKK